MNSYRVTITGNDIFHATVSGIPADSAQEAAEYLLDALNPLTIEQLRVVDSEPHP